MEQSPCWAKPCNGNDGTKEHILKNLVKDLIDYLSANWDYLVSSILSLKTLIW